MKSSHSRFLGLVLDLDGAYEEVVYDWGKLLCIPLRVSSTAGLRRRGDNVSWNRYVRQYVVIE